MTSSSSSRPADLTALPDRGLRRRSPSGEAFEEAAFEIGVLAALLPVLAVALFLLRREEREPEEA